MTTIYELTSWKYLLLYLSASNCFGVECQQSRFPRRKRFILVLTHIQRATSSPFLDHDSSRYTQQTISAMASHRCRKSSLDRASIESILKSGEPSEPAAAPCSHVGNSPNRASFAMAPPPRPAVKHTRALSYTPRTSNRLSLSFPVTTSTNSSDSSRQTPTSSRPTPTSSTVPSLPPTPSELPDTSPRDSNGFLVALAGQERRVLELKEELEKAEADLTKLKRQWALHEAQKKKAEIKHVEKLQPLQAVVTPSTKEEIPSTPRQSAEERRKAVLTSLETPKNSLDIPKEVRRKFSGQHMRALSLLSPERSNFTQSFPPVQESGVEASSMPKSATMPDIIIPKRLPPRSRNSYHGGVTTGAKQIAEDIKAGVWTFLEDLRQATVGDEAVNGTIDRSKLDAPQNQTPRRGSSEKSRRGHSPRETSPRTWDSLTGNSPLLDAAGNLWSDLDHSQSVSRTPLPSKKKSRTLSLAAPINDLDDDWSNWDSPTPKSPSPRWSGSTALSDPVAPSNGSVEDRNTKIMDQSADSPSTPLKREDIQWPALDKLSPGNLKGNLQRTMSTIMKEWERTLTPPPGDREDPMSTASEEKSSHDTATQDELVLMSR
ncbi:uncharacterized protein K444DRAFT_619518 [Hyaloscypha bicolor E]|uniref:DUF4048 domain-containing protein n=1 Tax=Hyaloscypha bicolor E TaxID=1095630 RepID=A0A2J6SPU0_9HELO|nr:uncharacterized protein K444DRAFT_619518 [Hyaloscypha bicolor E]PMD52808.1 hypothetical protein K444DRAFT_619518 [Hyaloscypha bicolor E]